jgi:hypothetical protein
VWIRKALLSAAETGKSRQLNPRNRRAGSNRQRRKREKHKTTKNKTMKIQIDLKSAVCGLIIGVAAMFAMGADSSSSSQVGKYQISSSYAPTGNAVITIIDTTTGEVWSHPTGTEGEGGTRLNNFWDKK